MNRKRRQLLFDALGGFASVVGIVLIIGLDKFSRGDRWGLAVFGALCLVAAVVGHRRAAGPESH
jgi:hypothetical protein